MSDLHKALADIGNIRQHLVAGTMFRGFGPSVIAATGVLAFGAAAAQSLLDPTPEAVRYIVTWTAVAMVSATLIGTEMVARSCRHHGGTADAMLFNALLRL